jgi:DNA-directed RNA polymerase II subunit RPB1
MVIPQGISIHRSPNPKSLNPIFDDGMMIQNGEIIFGMVEKKTVGALQGGLVHILFHEEGPDTTHQLFTGICHTDGRSLLAVPQWLQRRYW